MQNIKAKELDHLGFKTHATKSLLINILKKHFKHTDKEYLSEILTALVNQPHAFMGDPIFQKVVDTMIGNKNELAFKTYELVNQNPYPVYGKQSIEEAAIKQMDLAMSLPVSVQGALMPDAHSGYGLPIGGVLATRNVVIPYAVGVDIGCRMALSIVDASDTFFKSHHYQMEQAIRMHTHFGMDGALNTRPTHAILDDKRFSEMDLLKKLHGKANKQLGSSGGGNHFVEFGIVELAPHNGLNLPAGKYVALLTHSGSRGLGANIAMHFSQLAQKICKLPKQVAQLAWLDMNSEAGQDYWTAMHLAGDYAKACHNVIHHAILKSLGLQTLKHIDNHHNFAWQKKLATGDEVIVHRKGATPAELGTWGIIPGNMVDPAYIVVGKGNMQSLHSASHGAGRAMSRSKAKLKTTVSAMKKYLDQNDVTLIGGSVEESPIAYKNINDVMQSQKTLVHVEGKFYPKIIRMNKD